MAAFNIYTNVYLPMELGKKMAKSSGGNDDNDVWLLILLILFAVGVITLLFLLI